MTAKDLNPLMTLLSTVAEASLQNGKSVARINEMLLDITDLLASHQKRLKKLEEEREET